MIIRTSSIQTDSHLTLPIFLLNYAVAVGYILKFQTSILFVFTDMYACLNLAEYVEYILDIFKVHFNNHLMSIPSRLYTSSLPKQKIPPQPPPPKKKLFKKIKPQNYSVHSKTLCPIVKCPLILNFNLILLSGENLMPIK